MRINERIRLSPVRLIGADGEQVGVLPVDEALKMAREAGLDLVEVAATSRPIVCKIMDYGRFRFEQEKKAREAKKQQHQVDIKEVKYRPNINIHDFETKTRRARKFLEQGKHVKVTIMFRMREMRRPENGFELLRRVAEDARGCRQTRADAGSSRRSRSHHVDAAAQEIDRRRTAFKPAPGAGFFVGVKSLPARGLPLPPRGFA